MPHTQRTHIKRITALIAVVLVLILLLLYMQGTFVSKVSPGLSPQVNKPDPSMHNTTTVIKKLIDNKMAWPGTVKSKTVASIAPKMTARILEIRLMPAIQLNVMISLHVWMNVILKRRNK